MVKSTCNCFPEGRFKADDGISDLRFKRKLGDNYKPFFFFLTLRLSFVKQHDRWDQNGFCRVDPHHASTFLSFKVLIKIDYLFSSSFFS